MAELVDSVIKYMNDFHGKLKEAEETAQWEGIDGDEHKPLSTADLETDGGPITGTVFSTSGSHIPAQIIALGETYDSMQAATRLSKVYATTRKDYYAQSKDSQKVRTDRLSMRTTMLASTVNMAEPLRTAQNDIG